MGFLTEVVRSRILPAFVAALGVSFIAAGLLTYTTGTDATVADHSPAPILRPAPTIDVNPSAAPSDVVLPTHSPEPTSSAAPSSAPTSSATASSSPSSNPSPGVSPGAKRVATRVVIPALDIDLPIVKPPGGSSTYPLCNVAMYLQNLSQPGSPGATYLYAHARVGMFLPILDASRIDNGKKMIGMLVQVYTSDNMYFLYEITEVRRHQLTLADAISTRDQELWLQTSEGPRGTLGKTQLVATPLSNGPADPADAHPTAKPVVCG
jgi:sortase (surface protein transpeptidase)